MTRIRIRGIDQCIINMLMILTYSISEPCLLNVLSISKFIPFFSCPWLDVSKLYLRRLLHLLLLLLLLIIKLLIIYSIGWLLALWMKLLLLNGLISTWLGRQLMRVIWLLWEQINLLLLSDWRWHLSKLVDLGLYLLVLVELLLNLLLLYIILRLLLLNTVLRWLILRTILRLLLLLIVLLLDVILIWYLLLLVLPVKLHFYFL